MSRPMQPALMWRLSPTRTRFALRSRATAYPLVLVTLTCVGFALRLGLLSAFPLREDEAIYGHWARSAITDPFFLHIWPDKPPLFIWLLTGIFAFLGPSAESARLLSIFASTLTIPLIAVGARHLWHSQLAALLAALIITFSPFAISFAPTAYTDSLLVLLGSGALVLALRERPLAAGLLLGAACMTKQQGLFYAPLVIALLLIDTSSRTSSRKPQSFREDFTSQSSESPLWRERVMSNFLWALLGVALITLPILWWDSQRWAVAPSPWEMAQRTYAPLTWLPPQQWPSRVEAWSKLFWYLGGSWTAWLLLGVGMLGALLFMARTAGQRPLLALIWALFFAWGIAFILWHITTSVQVWDRYLLPLAPWLALMASGPLVLIFQTRLPSWIRGVFFLLLVVGMAELVYPAVDAARGQIPIGGDHGDYVGLTEAMAWVQEQCDSQLPSPNWGGLGRGSCPAILYHQVLGWHFRFYLYDDLQPLGDDPPRFDLRWFPSAPYLADNAAKSPYPPKYLIVPDWATPRDLALHLAMRGLALEPRLHVGRFAILEITQPARPLCDWCKSSLDRALPFAPIVPNAPQMSRSSTP